MITRTLETLIRERMGKGKAIIVFGARQVGKTTLLRQIAERLKQQSYARSFVKSYFWRTSAKQEIDYVEENNGQLTAYEFKWNPRKKVSVPPSFARSYPDARFTTITRDNYYEILL